MAKGRPKFRRMGNRVITYTDKKTADYEKAVEEFVRISLARFQFEPLSDEIWANITFYLPRPKSVRRELPSVKPDVDNYAKSVLDALEKAGIFKNDGQITDLFVRKRYADDREPGTHVEMGVAHQPSLATVTRRIRALLRGDAGCREAQGTVNV